MTDTVGFIQKLPTSLVAAFRGTLEEVVEADLLLEVVDATHENAIEQSETVNDVLAELGASDKPRVTALNKIDLLPDPSQLDTRLFPNAVPVSAVTGAGVKDLLTRVGDVLAERMVPARVLVPFARGDLLETFHRRGYVEDERQEEGGWLLTGSLPRELLGIYAPYRYPPPRRARGSRVQQGDDVSHERAGPAGHDGKPGTTPREMATAE
jgi:GTP-binding protein HflX